MEANKKGTYIFRDQNLINNFTTISNKLLRDPDLSFGALGLLTYLLSFPPDWKVYVTYIMKNRKEKQKWIYTRLKELEELGYLKKENLRGEKGFYSGCCYRIFESPQTVIGNAVLPLAAEPCAANQQLQRSTNNKEVINKTSLSTHTKDIKDIPETPENSRNGTSPSLTCLDNFEPSLAIEFLKNLKNIDLQRSDPDKVEVRENVFLSVREYHSLLMRYIEPYRIREGLHEYCDWKNKNDKNLNKNMSDRRGMSWAMKKVIEAEGWNGKPHPDEKKHIAKEIKEGKHDIENIIDLEV